MARESRQAARARFHAARWARAARRARSHALHKRERARLEGKRRAQKPRAWLGGRTATHGQRGRGHGLQARGRTRKREGAARPALAPAPFRSRLRAEAGGRSSSDALGRARTDSNSPLKRFSRTKNSAKNIHPKQKSFNPSFHDISVWALGLADFRHWQDQAALQLHCGDRLHLRVHRDLPPLGHRKTEIDLQTLSNVKCVSPFRQTRLAG
ncbi:hypothetical protein T492DRAFT_332648 [Pavlovales sp. CCMP2436]|nr:hypothetical protein T492DRAFT_332648 [Pavlovales sp. CCMP2436]